MASGDGKFRVWLKRDTPGQVPGLLLAAVLFTSASAAGQQPAAIPTLLREPSVRAALDVAKAAEPRTIEDQIRFCEIPAPPFKETARGDVLKREFTALGLQNIRVDRAGNVLGDRPGSAPRPHLVIAAHLDTVFPEETSVKVTRRGQMLEGPGIGDNCRGLAVLIAIVRAMNQADVRTPGTITFVADVGEEGLGDLRGMKALFGETMKGQIDRFVSLDNADPQVTIIGVGSHRYRITFKGPGGHSFAEFGLPNPANALGRAISKIADFQVTDNPRTTFNVGRIGGGTSVNAIPAEAWMEVDLRSSDSSALSALDAKFRQAVDRAVVEENARWGRPGVVTVVKDLVGDRPAGSISEDAPIVATAMAAARAVGLPSGISEGSTDANIAMSLNIPAITIGGGGRSINAHAPNEAFDTTDSWRGTENALLLTIALAR
jgi:acetylornithine deacetylase/succinyl-diaminopimelate desuccinylase-like protein